MSKFRLSLIFLFLFVCINIYANNLPVLVSPADNATCLDGNITFLWNSVDSAVNYKIEISDNSNFSSYIYQSLSITDTTFAYVVNNYNFVYYWRVQANFSDNADSLSTFFYFRSKPEKPNLLSPSDSILTTSTSVFFVWSIPDTLCTYDLQLSTVSDFSSGAVDHLTSADTLTVNLASNTVFYWRVSSVYNSCHSNWTNSRTLRTSYAPVTLTSPTDNNTCEGIYQSLTWTQSADTNSYRLQISTSSSLGTLLVDTLINTNSFFYNNFNVLTDYYWRVRVQGNNNISPWTNTHHFKTTISPPNLSAPANGTGSIPVNNQLNISWQFISPDTVAATYSIQISTTSNFQSGTILVTQSNLLITNYNYLPTQRGTVYYWRVQATHSGCATGYSMPFNFKTVYDTVVLSSPANLSTCISQFPHLTWNSLPTATGYTLQVSDNNNFITTVINASNIQNNYYDAPLTQTLHNYYWRVRALDNTSSGAWSKIWRFTTTFPNPALLSPVNNMIGVPLNTKLVWRGGDTTLRAYDLQVSTSTDFVSNLMTYNNLTDTSQSVTLSLYNTVYYWRIKTYKIDGCVSDWSATNHFKTVYTLPYLASPIAGSTCIPLINTFNWHPLTNITSYRIQISRLADFSTIEVNSLVSDTTFTTPIVSPYASYFWRVRAEDANNTGAWSAGWNFITTIKPAYLVSPANNSSGNPLNVTFKWNVPYSNCIFRFQLSDTVDFSHLIYDVNNITSDSIVRSVAGHNTVYYWRILTKFNSCFSLWSDAFVFTTNMNAPTLIAPPNNATNLSFTVVFSWNPLPGATTYDINVSSTPDFSSDIRGGFSIPQDTFLVANLSSNVLYYWRVRGKNDLNVSDWSTVFRFKTSKKGPNIPTLLSPADQAVKISYDTVLAWNQASGAITYNLQFASDPDFQFLLIDTTKLTRTTFKVLNLSPFTTYYWHVQAINDSGATYWSDTWNFRTVAIAPSTAPILLTPNNLTIDADPAMVNFSWNIVTNATFYDFIISKDSLFTKDTIWENAAVPYVITSVLNLEYSTWYFWKVRAGNDGGFSPWSSTNRFKTKAFVSIPSEPVDNYSVTVIPNPINNLAYINFTLSKDETVSIIIYDMSGRAISTIAKNLLNAGEHSIPFDGTNISNGVYVINFLFGNHSEQKVIVIDK